MKKSYLMLLLVAMFALVACNYNESEVVVDTTQTNEDADIVLTSYRVYNLNIGYIIYSL